MDLSGIVISARRNFIAKVLIALVWINFDVMKITLDEHSINDFINSGELFSTPLSRGDSTLNKVRPTNSGANRSEVVCLVLITTLLDEKLFNYAMCAWRLYLSLF